MYEFEHGQVKNTIAPCCELCCKPGCFLVVLQMYYEGGTTDTAGAIDLIRTQMFSGSNGDRANSPNIAVVITDGQYADLQLNECASLAYGHRHICTLLNEILGMIRYKFMML